jgi:hypothetical protein
MSATTTQPKRKDNFEDPVDSIKDDLKKLAAPPMEEDDLYRQRISEAIRRVAKNRETKFSTIQRAVHLVSFWLTVLSFVLCAFICIYAIWWSPDSKDTIGRAFATSVTVVLAGVACTIAADFWAKPLP